ncbi:hypothetical protein niasHS_012201 [Heterodera schachtii]|uniref:Uncharacterized protein n=2 Tax=Heterodera TaxID=34509 RepID=A0ABD2II15_HETSC
MNRCNYNQKIKTSNPLYGRGYFLEQKEYSNSNGCGFRKANRPLVPSNAADIESWEPKVMSTQEISKLTARCVGVTDAFIKLDNYVDSVKKYNPSNHDLLRMQRMQHQSKTLTEDPDKYAELIVQCVANPNKFNGTRHCLELVIGRRALEEFISRNEWTEERLKDYDINANWKFEPNELTVPPIPIYTGSLSSA